MSRQKVKLFAFLPLVMLAGCASAYDCYTCGQVNCGYCPPNAMTWSNSQNCNCSDTLGQEYISRRGASRSGGLISAASSKSGKKQFPVAESDINPVE